MYLTTIETALPDIESGECGYIELDTDGYLTLPNDKVGSLALSFWVKSNTDANIYVSDKSSTSTNEWQHVSFIFVSDGSDVDIKFSPANYYIYKVKMEEGSKITGWSLSPDDVLNSIDTLTVRVNKAEQLISPEGIISTVKNSEMYQDDINGIRGRLDVAEQKITKDAIVSTVKSGIDGEFLVSEINQSAGQVLIKADRIELDGDVLVNKIVAKGDVIDQVNSELLLEGNSIALTTGHFTINSENFKLDSAGNAEFSGEIKGSSGEFTEGFYLNSKVLLQNGYHADQIMRVENGEFELTYMCNEASKDKDPSDPYYAEHWFTNSIKMNQNGITIHAPHLVGQETNPQIAIASSDIVLGDANSDKVSVTGWLEVNSDLLIKSALNVEGGYIYANSKNVIQTTDNWLRINNDGRFTEGTYIAGHLLTHDFLANHITSNNLVYSNGGKYRCIVSDTDDKTTNVRIITMQNASGGPWVFVGSGSGDYGINAWASDTKLKNNIKDTNVGGLEFINSIRHISFDWKNNGLPVKIGYSANQLQELDPDVVFSVEQSEENEYDSILQIDHTKLIPYLSKAIQELHQEVENLKKQLQ